MKRRRNFEMKWWGFWKNAVFNPQTIEIRFPHKTLLLLCVIQFAAVYYSWMHVTGVTLQKPLTEMREAADAVFSGFEDEEDEGKALPWYECDRHVTGHT